jgi:hypothetical protein
VKILKEIEIDDFKLIFLCYVGVDAEEIINLEGAKLLKHLGYNKPSHWYWQDKTLPYVEKGLKRVKYNQRRRNHNKYDEWIYSAPTMDEVIKWFKKRNKL